MENRELLLRTIHEFVQPLDWRCDEFKIDNVPDDKIDALFEDVKKIVEYQLSRVVLDGYEVKDSYDSLFDKLNKDSYACFQGAYRNHESMLSLGLVLNHLFMVVEEEELEKRHLDNCDKPVDIKIIVVDCKSSSTQSFFLYDEAALFKRRGKLSN